MELHELPLGNGLHQTSYPDHPGLRLYTDFSASGFPMTSTSTQHAVTLWNPECYEGGPFDDDLSRASLLARWSTQNKVSYIGTFDDHFKKAMLVAGGLSDGADMAVEALDKVYYLRSGPKSNGNPLRRARETVTLSYCQLRDYLHYDAPVVPYLVACLVANRFTRHFTTTLHPRF